MVKQRRPDEVVNILEADFQSRYEHGFAWSSICAMFLDLPGLRAFWPTGTVNQYGDLADESGQGNVLDNTTVGANPALVNTRPLPPYVEFAGDEYFVYDSTLPGGLARGAGTLTTTTINDTSIPNHTHAITTTSDAQTTPSTILAGDANGALRLARLGVGVAAPGTDGHAQVADTLSVGEDDIDAGTIKVYGNTTLIQDGGELQLYMSADYDGVYQYWRLDAYEDDLRIGPAGIAGLLLTPGADIKMGLNNASTLSADFTMGDGNAVVALLLGGPNSNINSSRVIFADNMAAAYPHNGMSIRFDSSNNKLIIYDELGSVDRIDIIRDTGRVGIGAPTPLAQLHVDQASTTAAIPSLILDQADLSEEFIEFISAVGAGNPIDTAAVGTYYGKIRVNVSGVGYKYIALYNT